MIAEYRTPTEPWQLDSSIVREGCELGIEAVLKVVRTANEGDLPLFAATLGMPPRQFVQLWGAQAHRVIHTSRNHADLLPNWLPAEFPPLVELLWNYRSCDDRLNWWVCHAIASACFGHRHLWQDLGLRGREEVSQLLAERFCGLFSRNTQNLKWKRFLFLELGLRLGRPDLMPPACDGCDNYRSCFPLPKTEAESHGT